MLRPFVGARPASDSGLPIVKVPAGMGTMSNVTFVFGMVSVYGAGAVPWAAESTDVRATTIEPTASVAKANVLICIRRLYLARLPGEA